MTSCSVRVEVSKRDIAGLLCSAIEGGHGGIGYWVPRQDFGITEPGNPVPFLDGERVWPDYDYPLQQGGSVSFHAEDGTVCVLDLASIATGLALMPRLAPSHFADLIAGRVDATTGDVFVQLCVFGEVRYC